MIYYFLKKVSHKLAHLIHSLRGGIILIFVVVRKED